MKLIKKLDVNDMFALNIKRLREEKKWSQAELARQSKISSASINQLEKGTRSPTIGASSKIANALGIDVPDLFMHDNLQNEDVKATFYRKFRKLEQLSEENQEIVLKLVEQLINNSK